MQPYVGGFNSHPANITRLKEVVNITPEHRLDVTGMGESSRIYMHGPSGEYIAVGETLPCKYEVEVVNDPCYAREKIVVRIPKRNTIRLNQT